jgi:hypothetical protein
MDELLEEERPAQAGGEDLRGFEGYDLGRLRHSWLLSVEGRTLPVTGVAFSSAGPRLVSGGADHPRKEWDARTVTVHGPRVTEGERARSCPGAAHALWSQSLAASIHASDGAAVREEAASITPPPVPVDASVDVADSRKRL